MAKKKSYLEILKEEQAKDTQRRAEGRIDFKEDSRATRVQYSLPQYQGRSESKTTYKWEQELLDPLKFKGIRSYNDKFETWASQQGMTPGQASEFRKYMDFQEDSQWQEPELNKDGTIKQGQKLNYARGAYIKGGEEANAVNQMVQDRTKQYQRGNVLSNQVQFANVSTMDNVKKALGMNEPFEADRMENTRTAKRLGIDTSKPVSKEEWENALELERQKEGDFTDERDGFLGFLDSTLGRMGKASHRFFGEDFVRKQDENFAAVREAQLKKNPNDQNTKATIQMDNTVNREAENGLEKTSDVVGMIAGEMAPYTIGGAYGAADMALAKLGIGKVNNILGREFIRGATAGGIVGTGKSIVRDNMADNPEDFTAEDYAKTIGLESVLAGGGDMALGAVMRNLDPKYQIDQLLADTKSKKFTEDGFQKALQETYGDPIKFGQTAKPQARPTAPVSNGAAPSVTNALDSFTTSEIPNVEAPSALNDLNFAQSGGKPQARGTTPRVENPARYAKEDLGNMADTTLNRVKQLDGNRNQRVLEVMQDMKANKNLTPEQDEALTQAQQVWEQRQIREDEFLQQELAPYYESQQAQADIEQQWGTTVKQAKEEAKRIKQQFGKIHVTSGRGDDIVDQIPPQFRANKNEMAYDVYKMADEMGMTPEELVQYLKQLDNDSKLRKMDLGTDDGLKIDEAQWSQLEEAARRKFAETDEGKAIDQLFADSLEAGRPTDVDALYAANRGANDPATFDELIKLAEMETNARPIEPDLKTMLRNDPRIAEQVQGLNRLGQTTQAPKAEASPFDDILSFLDETAATSAPTRNPSELADEILKRFENVNNSQAVGQAVNNLDSTVQAATNGRQPLLMRLNAQEFSNTSTANTPPVTETGEASWIGGTNQETKMEKLVNLKNDAKTQLSSDLQPIKDVERIIAEQDNANVLSSLPDSSVSVQDSLYKSLRGVRRAISEAMKASKDDYGKILKDLRKQKISRKQFDAYISAVHFKDVLDNNHDLMVRAGEVSQRLEEIERLVQGTNDKKVIKQLGDEEKALLKEKTELEPYVLPKDATKENIEEILALWKDNDAIKQLQKDFVRSQRKDLDLLVRSGLYTKEQADAMISKHPNYIYMGRVKEELSAYGAGGNSAKPSKHIKGRKKGSEENIHNPLDSAIRNRILTYQNARRNMAMEKIEKLSTVNGANQFFNELNPNTATPSQLQNSVKFFKDGVEKRYEVPSFLKDAFDNLDARQAQDMVSSALKSVAQVTRKGATYFNTDFIFGSPFKDATGLITSRTNLHPGELVLGFMDSFMGKNLEKISGGKFKSYKAIYEQMGGHQTGFVTIDPQSTKEFTKAMDKGTLGQNIEIINPANWITKVGGAIEHGPKLAEFRSAKNKGYGNEDAMFEAVDVIDYSDIGSAIRKYNDKIPFLNPAIRGNVRYFQGAKENFPKWIGKNALYVSAPTTGIYLMRYMPTTSDEQRSKLRNMSEWQKNMFWHIPVPNSEKIYSVPKMHTAAQLFGNPIERVLDTVMGDNPKTWDRILKDTGKDSLTALIPPTAVAGVSQLSSAIANYDPLMDMPIEDATMKNIPDKSERYNSFTSEVAKLIGKTDIASPAKIDYVLKALTGGTGRDVLDITDNTLASLGVDRPSKVDSTLDILNPVRRYQAKDTAGLGTSNELYEQTQWDDYKGEDSGAAALYDEMKSLNKEIKGIRESKDLKPKEKQELIAELREYQRAIGDEAIRSGVLKKR
jgi:Large polyvalent protein associated domain 38